MKLLYIKCNPRTESESACLTVGRALADAYLARFPENDYEELDLYAGDIPILNFSMLMGQNEYKTGAAYDALPAADKAGIDRANALCESFMQADRYIIAAPMWSLTHPPMLKAYLDAVIQRNKTIRIEQDKIEGLMDDKPRKVVYVQSSGGKFSNLLLSRLNFSSNYLKSIFLFLGFEDFVRLPVEGTGDAADTKACAIAKAKKEIPQFVEDLA